MLPHGYQLLHLPQTGSTNSEAARLARRGEMQPHWILADEQTAGRGRRGRHWESPRGNLMATLYLPQEADGNLAFVAGLALAAAVSSYVTANRVSLKWPNDVLVDGAKIGGILLETENTEKFKWLAIGMGLNLVKHPKDTPYPATSIKHLVDNAPPPQEILPRLAAHFDDFLTKQRACGFETILTEWRRWAHNIGETVQVRLASKTLEGVFENIDERGALLLRLADGRQEVIMAGDVFFPKADAP